MLCVMRGCETDYKLQQLAGGALRHATAPCQGPASGECNRSVTMPVILPP
jgi:hypothetical protein